MMQTILVVEDEDMIREAVASYLEKQGNHVIAVENGKDALQVFEREPVSFVILDLMLPDMTGEEICSRIRKESRVPIIMLTAKVQEEDVLNGLGIGADDYMKKPFSLKELYARVQVIQRRSEAEQRPLAQKFSWNQDNLVIDIALGKVSKNGNPVQLTASERKILYALIRHPQKIYTRDELLEIAFGADFDGYDRVIDTHIKNLRKKIEDDPKNPIYIKTVHGIGYRFGGDIA